MPSAEMEIRCGAGDDMTVRRSNGKLHEEGQFDVCTGRVAEFLA